MERSRQEKRFLRLISVNNRNTKIERHFCCEKAEMLFCRWQGKAILLCRLLIPREYLLLSENVLVLNKMQIG